jgi:hypothetical protein
MVIMRRLAAGALWQVPVRPCGSGYLRIKGPEEFLSGPASAGPFLWRQPRDTRNAAQLNTFALAMMHRHFEGQVGSRHYSRWPDTWRPEDDWGPITAAVMFLIILAGLIVYGSGVHL